MKERIFTLRPIYWLNDDGRFYANTFNGKYEIWQSAVATNKSFFCKFPTFKTVKQYTSLEDAKLAAWIDYESAAEQVLDPLNGARDITNFIDALGRWSKETFGPDYHPARIIEHIRKELIELEQDPDDCAEWIDVIFLALDGARRSGHDANWIVMTMDEKHDENQSRKWPDWKTQNLDKPIEHIRKA
jgi:hypothetical protein